MLGIKKFISIVFMFALPSIFIFAQSAKNFVCRVVPNEDDKVYQMLLSAKFRFEEYNYKNEADKIKKFLSSTGNTGVVIRDDSGKKYVLTSGEESLSDFTEFDVHFAPDNDSEPVVLRGLKISALDAKYHFLLIELPESYSGKALRVTNAVPVQGQNVVVPDFSTNHWEEHYATVSNAYNDREYFTLSYKDTPVGSPVLLHDSNTDSAYTLLGVNHIEERICQAEKNPAISDFLKNWRYSNSIDTELPLNLFVKTLNKKTSIPNSKTPNSTDSSIIIEEIGGRFISTELLRKLGADLYISNSGNSKYGNKYSDDPYRGILFGGDSWLNDVYFGNPFAINIRGSLLVPTEYSRKDDKGFDITALASFQYFGAGLFYQQEKLAMEYKDGTGDHRASTFGGLIRLQIPVNAWRFIRRQRAFQQL